MNLSRAIAGFFSSSSSSSSSAATAAFRRGQKWPSIREIPVAAVRTAVFSTDAASPNKRTNRKTSKATPKPELVADQPGPSSLTLTAWDKELLLSDPPRPSEVPFQPKVANAAHLVGTISVPVQLQALPDGSYVAVSVLVHEKTRDFPQFWIPVTFQGDLAQIAASHLKEGDVVYVTGMLSGDTPPFTFKEAETNIQVLAHSLSFVKKGYSAKEKFTVHDSDEVAQKISESKEDSSAGDLWNDLIANPRKWWDNRSSNRNPNSPAFKHKDTGKLLWVNESTPEWVLSQLEQLPTGQKSQEIGVNTDNSNMSEKYVDKPWNDLVLNPQDWKDHRMDKLNKKVNPKFPDFTHKSTSKGLWLNSAPSWVSKKMDTSEFNKRKMSNVDVKNNDALQSGQNEFGNSGEDSKFRQNKSFPVTIRKNDEILWKSLVEDPSEWWDNRAAKFSAKSPDFKNKKTGEGLWLSSYTPQWVKLKLPPLNSEKKSEGQKKAAAPRATLLS